MNKGNSIAVKCPVCKGADINKNGHYNGRQRYVCRCGKTFAENSLERPEINFDVQSALHLLILGYAENDIADVMNLAAQLISDWRYKFLPKLKSVQTDKPLKINVCYDYIRRLQRGNRPERLTRRPSSRGRSSGGANPPSKSWPKAAKAPPKKASMKK